MKRDSFCFSVAFIAVLLSVLSNQANAEDLSFPLIPDETQTAGSLCDEDHADFERYRYKEEIPYCRRNVSTAQKSAIFHRYGVSKECRDEYTIDHFIPLSLGGDNSYGNLWPEHKQVKALRRNLENELFHALDEGRISQKKAIQRITEAKWNPPVEDLPDDFDPCVIEALQFRKKERPESVDPGL